MTKRFWMASLIASAALLAADASLAQKADPAVVRFDPGKVGPFDAGAEHHCGFWKTLYPKILTQ